MKLFEIYNIEDNAISAFDAEIDSNLKYTDHPSAKIDDKKVIGSGAYSYAVDVSDDDQHSHEVKKISRKNQRDTGYKIRKDGFWYYADFIVKHKLYNNPFFPRIYTIKKTYDNLPSGYENAVEYHMEKLSPIVEYSDWDGNSYSDDNYYLSDNEYDYLFDLYFGNSKKHDFDDVDDKIEHLIYMLEQVVIYAKSNNKTILNEITYEPLVEAYYMFVKMFNYFRMNKIMVSIDLHGENFMSRKTPYGTQIVYTDPFTLGYS